MGSIPSTHRSHRHPSRPFTIQSHSIKFSNPSPGHPSGLYGHQSLLINHLFVIIGGAKTVGSFQRNSWKYDGEYIQGIWVFHLLRGRWYRITSKIEYDPAKMDCVGSGVIGANSAAADDDGTPNSGSGSSSGASNAASQGLLPKGSRPDSDSNTNTESPSSLLQQQQQQEQQSRTPPHVAVSGLSPDSDSPHTGAPGTGNASNSNGNNNNNNNSTTPTPTSDSTPSPPTSILKNSNSMPSLSQQQSSQMMTKSNHRRPSSLTQTTNLSPDVAESLNADLLKVPTPGSPLASSSQVPAKSVTKKQKHSSLASSHLPISPASYIFPPIMTYIGRKSPSSPKHSNFVHPERRIFHTCVVIQGVILLYGGLSSKGVYCDDLWQYEDKVWTPLSFGTYWMKGSTIRPPAKVSKSKQCSLPIYRYGHSAIAYDDRYMIIYGGCSVKERDDTTLMSAYLNDLWKWDTQTLEWSQIILSPNATKPPPTKFHSAVYRKCTGTMYIFGGTGYSLYNDLWEFRFATNQWKRIETDVVSSPKPRFAHSAIIYKDIYMLLTGGRGKDSLQVFSNMHLYDFDEERWRRVNISGDVPSPRYHHSLVGSTLMYGGINRFGLVDSLHELDLPLAVNVKRSKNALARDIASNLYSNTEAGWGHKCILSRSLLLKEIFSSVPQTESGQVELTEDMMQKNGISLYEFENIKKYLYGRRDRVSLISEQKFHLLHEVTIGGHVRHLRLIQDGTRDFILWTAGRKHKEVVHRCLLECRSSKFASIFRMDAQQNEYDMNLNRIELKLFVDGIYGLDITPGEKAAGSYVGDVIELLKHVAHVATSYNIHDLSLSCLDQIEKLKQKEQR